MADTFDEIIGKLEEAIEMSKESRNIIIGAEQDLKETTLRLESAIDIAENAVDKIREAMGIAEPEDIENAIMFLVAGGMTAFTCKAVLVGVDEHMETSIMNIDTAIDHVERYVGRIA